MADEGANASGDNQPPQSHKKEEGAERKLTEASSSSAELNPPIPDIDSLNTAAFSSLVTYVQDDLSAVAEDYKLLEKMNKATIDKYAEMKEISTSVYIEMMKINDKYRNLAPYLEQIDQIEESVGALEEVAYRLDGYSKRLEAKFKQLEKR